MAKPKEIDAEALAKRKHRLSIMGKVLLFLLLTFVLASLCSSKESVFGDYYYLKANYSSFSNLFSQNRVEMDNPAGIVGALTAYSLIRYLGHMFSFFVIALSLIHLTLRIATWRFNFLNKLTLFLIHLVFILYNFAFYFDEYFGDPYQYRLEDKLFFQGIYYFISAMFGKVGTPIFCFVALIASLRLLFTFNPITILFRLCISGFRAIFTGWKSPFRAKPTIDNPDPSPPPITVSTNDTIPQPTQPLPININETNIHIGADEIPKSKDAYAPEDNDDSYSPAPRYISEQNQYQKPDIEQFLTKPSATRRLDKEKLALEVQTISQILIDKLAEFGLLATVVNVNIGPIITQYELQPAPGIKVREFTARSEDIALALHAESIRVQAPIPGRGLIGVEVPNKTADMIYMHDIFFSSEMINNSSLLAVALGKDIAGHPIVTDLVKMPHLLIAGATGAGKSVCINTIITSLLLRCSPEDVRLVMIDPKRIELTGYEDIPHLIQNVVTEPEDALGALNWAVYEMERRYTLLQELKVRDIVGYNQKVEEMKYEEGDMVLDHLPYIVVIIDEFADLIMTAGKEIELPITRLAQKARAIGIHLILATQRPSIKVITGLIKANFPARIAFRVSSQIDSRVILDAEGANKLLGRGDMLFLPPGKSTPERIHGAYLSDSEIEGLVEYLKTQPKPHLNIEMHKPEMVKLGDFQYDDDLFPEAVRVVVTAQTAAVSMLQRHFKIGYARAGRLIDLLEQAGVIGPHIGSKSREVLMKKEDL